MADSVIIRRPWWARDEIGIATGLWQLRPTARRSLTPGRRALGHVLHGGVKSGTHLEPREGLGWATVPTTPSPDQEDATTTANMPLDDLLVELGDRDRDALRVILERTVQALVEAEVTAVIGADRHERTQERVTYRKGHRARVLDTRVGRLQLEIPTPRQGSFLPSLADPHLRLLRLARRRDPGPGAAPR